MTLITFVVALTSWLICWQLVKGGDRLLDFPNERSLHEHPVPRGGGIGILLGITMGLIWVPLPVELYSVVILTLILGGFSFLDDLYRLTPLLRFLIQGIVAFVAVKIGFWPTVFLLPGLKVDWPAWFGMIFGWLLLVWMTNLFNFMDGMDGLAGGMAIIGFGTLGILGWLGGDKAYAMFCATVSAASVGFIYFNFPPARLFMGDVGSAALGFLAAVLILRAHDQALFPLWVGILVFFPFILDATITLARRLLRGEQVWQPHRSHYYQRLVRMGWGHRKTVEWEYGIMAFCALAALLAVSMDMAGQWGVMMAVLLVHISAMVWIEISERKGDAVCEDR